LLFTARKFSRICFGAIVRDNQKAARSTSVSWGTENKRPVTGVSLVLVVVPTRLIQERGGDSLSPKAFSLVSF